MQADDDLAHRHRHALFLADIGSDLAQHAHGPLDRAAGTAGILNVEMPLRSARTALAVQRQLVDLAAEADHQHAAEIHMPGIAGERPVQHVHAVAGRTHAAALVMHDRHETVDALIMRQDRPVRLVGDRPADRGGTVHAGDDADIVAGRRPPVGAAVTHEGARLVVGRRRLRRRIGGRRQPVVFEMQVVAVHMVAGPDLFSGAADRLSVFHHGRPERNIRYRHLVAGVDLLTGFDAGNRRTRRDCRRCDRDIVSGRKDDPRQFVQFILPRA